MRVPSSGGSMRKESGFTLIELMVVIAMLGILAVTAVPFYQTYQQRAYGSEASLMAKKIMDGQIMYYLENNKFFPMDRDSIEVFANDSQDKPEVQQIAEALKITIPVGHHLNYAVYPRVVVDGKESCQIHVSAGFPLFKDGSKMIIGIVYATGETRYITGG